jgi:hypothetical protein
MRAGSSLTRAGSAHSATRGSQASRGDGKYMRPDLERVVPAGMAIRRPSTGNYKI